jgi:hypothetical protein
MKGWGAKRRCKDDPDQQISLTPTEADKELRYM